ncbi:IS21-like element helper ATPase IstB [Streptomyces sp. enrichment culture]|uniref:IS21-like element helper ATPase IstB n=1 Tax=Streptomyces sp. enrichment culture TaxID=1795815 RepID=UPI003F550C5F
MQKMPVSRLDPPSSPHAAAAPAAPVTPAASAPAGASPMTTLGYALFATRWLQAPLYFGLVAAQGVYVYKFFSELWKLVEHVISGQVDETHVMLAVLKLVDVVMIANLLIMVIVGGYETFVSRIGLQGHRDQPEWLSHVNSNVLKVKLATAIVGISSVHLLQMFVDVHHTPEHDLLWGTVIHMAFIASALILAYMSGPMNAHEHGSRDAHGKGGDPAASPPGAASGSRAEGDGDGWDDGDGSGHGDASRHGDSRDRGDSQDRGDDRSRGDEWGHGDEWGRGDEWRRGGSLGRGDDRGSGGTAGEAAATLVLPRQAAPDRAVAGTEARIAAAGFPARKELEAFDATHLRAPDPLVLERLGRLDFVARRENVVFLGGPGTGKTHLAVALGVRACEAGKRVLFAPAPEWGARLRRAKVSGRLADELAALDAYALLVVDELGYVPFDPETANLFFQLVAHRYERASMIVTSDRPFGRWGEVFGDAGIASATVDRLVHHAEVVTLEGDSYRTRGLAGATAGGWPGLDG